MKTTDIMRRMIKLLLECGVYDKAKWLEVKVSLIQNANTQPYDKKKYLTQVKQALGGMGSFSDLSLTPKKNSKMSCNEAKDLQWELVEKFDAALERDLESIIKVCSHLKGLFELEISLGNKVYDYVDWHNDGSNTKMLMHDPFHWSGIKRIKYSKCVRPGVNKDHHYVGRGEFEYNYRCSSCECELSAPNRPWF